MELYYLQDSRNHVGNDILWWAWNGSGYTTDLRKAHVYTKKEAIEQHKHRESDVPWPKDYIDQRTSPGVDFQCCDIKKALKGTGIELIKPKKYNAPMYNCHGCGRFMTERQIYTEDCNNCGADNSP